MTDFPADGEEPTFRRFLEDTSVPSPMFKDALYARVTDALADLKCGRATPLDVAVLVRQVLRRASIRDGADFQLVVTSALGLRPEDWQGAGITALKTRDGATMLLAAAWQPAWLSGAVVDTAAAAGTQAGVRAMPDSLPADPMFEEATTYPMYRTAGLRAAVRAAISMPQSGTLIALLPTGSGKTEIATTLAHLARRQTTIIVVPTVALAYDFERRFRETFGARNKRVNPERLIFAWTGETDPAQREEFRRLLVAGEVPLLVTSPESLTGPVLHSARNAAEGGRLRALVIDEAHLVTQWGRDFRPEFRQLAGLRADLLARSCSAGHPAFRTVLLSATLGAAELDDLAQLFGDPGPLCLVAANALRPEPEYWVAPIVPESERARRVLEAVSRLPRPTILYVTRPDAADNWERRLRESGYGRVAVVTGNSAGADRREVLEGLRAGGELTSRYDIVVATSAFGLGIDNDQIRSVIHACLPETLDRWYQEVGRSGRDGHASVAVLVPAYRDDAEAASLGITMLKPETASSRWNSLWSHRFSIGEESYVDLHQAPTGVDSGSYNRRWNAQVMRGLEELRQIERRQLTAGEAAQLKLPVGTFDDPHEWELVKLVHLGHQGPDFFDITWEGWRRGVLHGSQAALDQMKAVLQPEASVCTLLAAAYRASPVFKERHPVAARGVEPMGRCGRCPGCRARGVVPHVSPPPRGVYTWIPEDRGGEALSVLLVAAPIAQGLAILHGEDTAAVATSLANGLAAAGVRVFAGATPTRPPSDWWCTDDAAVNVGDLPPLPALIVPPADTPVDEAWIETGLRPTAEDGVPAPLVMLVKTGTPVGAGLHPVERLKTLNVDVALKLLKGTG